MNEGSTEDERRMTGRSQAEVRGSYGAAQAEVGGNYSLDWLRALSYELRAEEMAEDL